MGSRVLVLEIGMLVVVVLEVFIALVRLLDHTLEIGVKIAAVNIWDIWAFIASAVRLRSFLRRLRRLSQFFAIRAINLILVWFTVKISSGCFHRDHSHILLKLCESDRLGVELGSVGGGKESSEN
jgi:hypothetical protein